MDLMEHTRCDCHACTQQRAAEGLGGLAVGIQQMNNLSNSYAGGLLGQISERRFHHTVPEMIEMLRQAIREELEARERFEVK